MFEFHKDHGKITEFGGFDMPLWYRGIVEEHNAVRNAAGLFDVSHMGRFSINGPDATRFLDHVLPTKVNEVKEGRAFYSAILNENGGIVDDIVTNKYSASEYLMVVNAANRKKDLAWLSEHLERFSVEIEDVSESTALVAFQGPLAIGISQKLCDVELASLRRFSFAPCNFAGEKSLVSRTGYTGEDGVEITIFDCPINSPEKALKVWGKILTAGESTGVLPCGLGARDSLRLEAGMCLYGQDIDDTTSPLEAGLESIVSLDKADAFIGRESIEIQSKKGVSRKRASFSMLDTGIPRHGYDVTMAGKGIGLVSSGTFSPTIKKGIGMAYVPPVISATGSRFSINLRGSDKQAEVVTVPFYDTTKFGYKRLRH
ncbi:MAG: glycine cleavage system aminomethyltransferase GcvT [Nitrososphaerales archaeon]